MYTIKDIYNQIIQMNYPGHKYKYKYKYSDTFNRRKYTIQWNIFDNHIEDVFEKYYFIDKNGELFEIFKMD